MEEILRSNTTLLDGAIKRALEADVDWWFECLMIFIAFVAIGVVLEGVEYFQYRVVKIRMNPQTGYPIIPFRRIEWIHRVCKFGWLLVALGVVGEYVVEKGFDRSEGLLRDFNTVITDAAASEIASTRLAAGQAMERAEKIQAENLRLQKQILLMGPRANVLVGDAHEAFTSRLIPFARQRIVVQRMGLIGAINGISAGTASTTKEMSDLVDALIAALVDAHWEVRKDESLSSVRGSGVTVHVVDGAPSRTRRAAVELVRALNTAEILANAGVSLPATSGSDPGTILLVVHPR